MTRRIFFQIHWFLGITAGLVLAVMGVTGAMLSFEDEIMAAISPGIVTLAPGNAPHLDPDTVIARAAAQRHGLRVASLTVEEAPDRAWRIQFDPPKGEKGRGERSFVDPRDGRLLGNANGSGFFRTVTSLHRWLALPGGGNGIGRQITAFSAISLIFFALSGLYLRWPKRALDWRAWLVLDLRKSGRNLYRALHAVIGGWIVLFYLLSATTGLWWSYDWYRQGVLYALTGKTSRGEQQREEGKKDADPVASPSLKQAWPAFTQLTGNHFESVTITLPKGKKPVDFRMLLPDARHERMTDTIRIDPAHGRVVKVERYSDRTMGEVITTSMLEVHRGAIFGLPGRLFLFVTSLTMPLFTITGLLLYIARRRKKRPADEQSVDIVGTPEAADMLVAFASQTGGAERLARQTAAALGATRVLPLTSVDAAQLAQVDRALFVISTYGEGEPPDRARRFARQDMAQPPAAAHLHYAVLALGDREYADFCAFGHQVDHWLHAGGGQRMFDMIEVDGEDADAHRQWQQQLAALGARPDAPDWAPARYGKWRLVERRLLNPGSVGGPAHLVALEPCDGLVPDWEAGDIAEILPRNDPQRVADFLLRQDMDGATIVDDEGTLLQAHLAGAILPESMEEEAPLAELRALPHREYSVASIAADGRIELLIRQVRRDDGRLGLGSGWLTRHAPLGGEVDLRIHANLGFRAPPGDRRLILIGNGTGLAGLRGHLRQSAARGVGGHWLFLGERNAAHDAFLSDELERMLAEGTLERLDRAYSRDVGCGRYVQHLVEAQATTLRAWVEDGAAILVCGSLEGMAPAVDAALRTALGDERLETMAEAGLYRRDIY